MILSLMMYFDDGISIELYSSRMFFLPACGLVIFAQHYIMNLNKDEQLLL